MTPAELRTDAVVLACAISAGIHGALVPQHLRESAGAGLGFVAATALLAACAAALTRYPASRTLLTGAAALLAGLVVSYVLAVTTGLPVLQPEAEPVTGLALLTKAVEAAGLVAASPRFLPASITLDLRRKGTAT